MTEMDAGLPDLEILVMCVVGGPLAGRVRPSSRILHLAQGAWSTGSAEKAILTSPRLEWGRGGADAHTEERRGRKGLSLSDSEL